MEAITIEQYQNAIINALSPSQIEILQVLYYFPNSSATAKELADALNYSHFIAVNGQIGRIGRKISEYIEVMPKTYFDSKSGSEKPAWYYIVGEYYDNGWNMWEELQIALENLNLVTMDKIGNEVIDRLPTETFQFDETQLFKEGKIVQTFVNRFERNQKARLECIRHFGNSCYVCGFNFEKVYGDIAKGFIHVHHRIPLAEINEEYEINPITDLIPLCPNCHSTIHLSKPVLTIEELKKNMKIKP